MSRIFVVGSANVDLNVRVPSLPGPGETLAGGAFDTAMGGKGANQAVAAARLGGQVTFLGAVGDDDFGQACLDAYRAENLDVSLSVRRPGAATGVALITVADDGANTIVLAPGANGTLRPEGLNPLRESIGPEDLLLLQLEIPMETAEAAAKIGAANGARVILDPAPAPAGGLAEPLFAYLFALLPNEHETAALVPQAGDLESAAYALRNRGVDHAIVTTGETGVLWVGPGGLKRMPAYPASAVDTVAAGDVFAGALAVALSENRSMPEAIDWGQRAASLSVTRQGAQPSMPAREEVERMQARG